MTIREGVAYKLVAYPSVPDHRHGDNLDECHCYSGKIQQYILFCIKLYMYCLCTTRRQHKCIPLNTFTIGKGKCVFSVATTNSAAEMTRKGRFVIALQRIV